MTALGLPRFCRGLEDGPAPLAQGHTDIRPTFRYSMEATGVRQSTPIYCDATFPSVRPRQGGK